MENKENLKKMVKALTFAIFCSIIEMVEIINYYDWKPNIKAERSDLHV